MENNSMFKEINTTFNPSGPLAQIICLTNGGQLWKREARVAIRRDELERIASLDGRYMYYHKISASDILAVKGVSFFVYSLLDARAEDVEFFPGDVYIFRDYVEIVFESKRLGGTEIEMARADHT